MISILTLVFEESRLSKNGHVIVINRSVGAKMCLFVSISVAKEADLQTKFELLSSSVSSYRKRRLICSQNVTITCNKRKGKVSKLCLNS